MATVLLALVSPGLASDFIYSNIYGTATLFGSGPLATNLAVNATNGDSNGSDSVNYLDAISSPATVVADASGPSSTLVAIAQLEQEPLQLGGLDETGNIHFDMDGASGTAGGSISLYLLISVPDPADIEIFNIRSTVTTAGSPSSVFSLNLFQSDASGDKFGSAVLSLGGDNFDTAGSYQTSMPYYLFEMDVAANATPTSVEGVDFTYSFDLGPIASVPEPNSTTFLVMAGIVGLAFQRFLRRRNGGLRKEARWN